LFWALAHWSFYDDRERHQIDEQIRLLWRVDPDTLIELAQQAPMLAAPMAAALAAVDGAGERLGPLLDGAPWSGDGPTAGADDRHFDRMPRGPG
jgi:hypothetical protein